MAFSSSRVTLASRRSPYFIIFFSCCLVFYLLSCIQISWFRVHSEFFEVRLKSGVVNGTFAKAGDFQVKRYLGIPYAQPPLGDLRFRKPLPISHHGEIAGNVWPPFCVQPRYFEFSGDGSEYTKNYYTQVESEDCLYLNVWTPVTKSDELKPVMFCIHSGAYEMGTASGGMCEGSVLSAMNDVVVVSFNYRLNVIGFLYGGSDEAPGNVGFWDQALALEWTKNNIRHFGGDPDRVTIFGISSGAMSVTNHILSPHTRHLFRNAIVMSGTSLGPVYHVTKEVNLNRAHKLAKVANCQDSNDVTGPLTKQSIDCLRKVDAKQLIAFSKDESVSRAGIFLKIPFVPVFGDEFLPKTPSAAFRTRDYKKNCPVLIGATNDEGAMYERMLESDKSVEIQELFKTGTSSAWKEQLKKKLSTVDIDNSTQQSIVDFYFSTSNGTTSSSIKAYRDALGEYTLTCPTLLFGEQIMDGNNVFGYHTTYKTYSPALKKICPDHNGVCHGADQMMILGEPFKSLDLFDDDDREESLIFMKIFTDFAKNGKAKWKAHEKTKSGLVLPFSFELNHHAKSPLKTDFKYLACKLWETVLIV